MLDINQQFEVKSNCLNCQSSIGESEDFCNKCGQKVHIERLVFWQVMKQAIGKFFEVDEGGFAYAFKELFLRPERIPMDYIMGKRTSFMKPVPYFIIPMIFYILLSSNLENSIWTSVYEGMAESNAENTNSANQESLKYLLVVIKDQRLFIFTTVIALSFGFRLIFKKVKLNFAEHMVFNLYIQGHTLLLSIPILILMNWFSEHLIVFVYLMSLIYSVWAIKRFYKTNIIKSLFAYIIGYFIYYMLIIVGLFLFLFCIEIMTIFPL
jgi:hypothetical protein